MAWPVSGPRLRCQDRPSRQSTINNCSVALLSAEWLLARVSAQSGAIRHEERRSESMRTKANAMLLTLTLTLALVALVLDVQAHGIHAMHEMVFLAADSSSSTSYKCPVCGMSTEDYGYDDENYVVLANGQRVYTCGMEARSFSDYSFDVTDTAYLAANMAEFVVNETNSDFSVCSSSCSKCADGNLSDPISGANISADGFEYVCLTKGQKIYFASTSTKDQYLSNVNQAPRYQVESIICEGATCSDATNITILSAAAASMVPYLSTTASSTTTASTSGASTSSSSNTATSSDDSSNDFCSGQGSVMLNGFQSSISGSCVLLFFGPWGLTSAVKYFFGFIGCFAIGLTNEYTALGREHVRQALRNGTKADAWGKWHKQLSKVLLALMYMVQMALAYFAMLVAMTYETGLFCALLAGFGSGFVLFKNLDVDVSNERGAWRFVDSSTVRLRISGMTCMAKCGTTVERALLSVPGVTNAFVEFSEQCAYVSGYASLESLVEAVESVGFSAESASDRERRTSQSLSSA